jgi:4-hydroxybenzoate polyprenyltransferase/phosphoserine phosphatase
MLSPIAPAPGNSIPLCVDLDGTLLKTDLLWESLVRLLKQNPFCVLAVPLWWMRGRAFLKRQIAARVELDIATLPCNKSFVVFLRDEKRQGRPLILATASDRELATQVADQVGLFDEVLASDGKMNLRAGNKARSLTGRFGERGFDYAGNSSPDLVVWAAAREAIVVNAGAGLTAQAARRTKLGQVFDPSHSKLPTFLQCLRPHHWIKNLIIFVPLLTSHQIGNWPLLVDAFWAFVAFSLCASGVYMLNDLLDLDADRHHPEKKNRPFASGDLPLPVGLVMFPLLFLASVLVSFRLPLAFTSNLAIYFAVTTSYSCWFKQVAILDVFVLAGLYSIRLVAGQLATGIVLSDWLLVFSMFVFLSLALAKRFLELQMLRQKNKTDAKGRGYATSDQELVATLGLVSGYVAVLVLALYVNSPQVVILYRRPTLLLLVCLLFLYWLSRVWFIAHRGQMRDDPVVFALRDWVSHVVGALMLLVLWLAT